MYSNQIAYLISSMEIHNKKAWLRDALQDVMRARAFNLQSHFA